MKGHLGTKLQDKSEIVIGVSIDKENDSNRIVQSLASRNRRPDPFQFTILEDGMPDIQNEDVSVFKMTGKKQPKTDKPDYQLFQLLTASFSKCKGEVKSYRYGEIVQQICLEFEKQFKENIGDNMAKKLLTKFLDNAWILKSGEHGQSRYFLGEFDNGFL